MNSYQGIGGYLYTVDPQKVGASEDLLKEKIVLSDEPYAFENMCPGLNYDDSLNFMLGTGKYTFEEIMDPAKCRKEKAEMFEKVANAMTHITPENQKWIAEQIYKAQAATEKMMQEQAQKIDFSNPDIMQDKQFVMMLHVASHQHDAWQEMSHCQKEILELAKKDHPEMNKWEDICAGGVGKAL
ncbi:MAG: hypothetical protein K6E75_10770 [Lachnospiraceae bacterium]|nr:hypothetical protein [Lachnospiraceae bacterium]